MSNKFLWLSRSKFKVGFSILILTFCLTWSMVVVLGQEPKCQYVSQTYAGLKPTVLSEKLENNNGLIGRIHGAVKESGVFVLTVRDPENFFNAIQYSLVSRNRRVNRTLSSLHRHDRICVTGELLANPSPQNHILVKQLQVLESRTSERNIPAYDREIELPAALKGKDSFIGKVNAISGEGKILVLEYRDAVIPVFAKDSSLTKDLYRNDIVKVYFERQKYPRKPVHLLLAGDRFANPLEVIESIASLHQNEITLEGNLVKFPRSPQINFDVFAIEQKIAGTKRYYTLVNFQDPEKFREIRTKLETLWQRRADSIVNGRNMLVNPELKLLVRGTLNVVSPQQANPQILLESVDSITAID